MAEKPKSKSAKPIVDVAHPNKTAPSGNSKSVIVTNRPILKDPMVVDDENLAKNPDKIESPAAPSAKAPKFEPSQAESKKDESYEASTAKIDELAAAAAAAKAEKEDEKPAPEPEPKEEPSKEEPKTDTASTPKPEEQKTDDAKPTEPSKEKSEDIKPADSPAPEDDKKTEDAPAEEPQDESKNTDKSGPTNPDAEQAVIDQKQAEHEEAIRKLRDSKKYYLPINAVEKRRSKHFVILGVVVSVILILVWVDIALDAAIINIPGVKPVTHFFSN